MKNAFPTEIPKEMSGYFKSYTARLSEAAQTVDPAALEKAAEVILTAVKAKKQIFSCGNGGSAAIANHLNCDFLKGIRTDTALTPVVKSLSSEISLVTAIGNDIGYSEIFSYQLESLAKPGDVLIAVSSSGSSPNIVRALETMSEKGGRTILMCGFSGGAGKDKAEVALHYEVDNYGIVEDLHHVTMHCLAQYIRLPHLQKSLSDPTVKV